MQKAVPIPEAPAVSVPAPVADVKEAYYGWTDLVAHYEKIDQGGAPFLRGAKVFVDGEKKLHVELSDSFAKRLLESVSAASKLRAIAVSQGDSFTDVIIEIAKPETNTRSAFDDLF